MLFFKSSPEDIFSDFREREAEGGREGKERERNIGLLPLLHTPDGDHSGMCPDQELNWLPFSLQAGTQSTKPHQPGLILCILKLCY